MLTQLKRLRGWIRLHVWSVCPACNSDAPKLYDCRVCNGLTSHDASIRWPWSKRIRASIWESYEYIMAHRPQDL